MDVACAAADGLAQDIGDELLVLLAQVGKVGCRTRRARRDATGHFADDLGAFVGLSGDEPLGARLVLVEAVEVVEQNSHVAMSNEVKGDVAALVYLAQRARVG